MGCQLYFQEDPNILIRKAIKELDFTTLHKTVVDYKLHNLDPTLIHEGAKSGHIDILSILLEYHSFFK